MTPFLFIIITSLSLLLFYYGIGKNKKFLISFLIWQLAVGIIASTGILLKKPHYIPPLILVTSLLVIYWTTKIDRKKLNETMLLSIHVLRIPVELILYQLFLNGKIPKLMTFSGWNFDIVIGFSALTLLIYVGISKKWIGRKLFIVWNFSGLLFLFFIVALSVLSSPLKIQKLAFDQPNIGVAEFPFCFLPTCVVPIVLMSHILLLQKTVQKPSII